MRTGLGKFLVAAIAIAAGAAMAARVGAQSLAPLQASPKEIYQALNALRVDASQIYPVSEIRLRRDGVSMTFSSGTIALMEAYDGRVTGAVFSGRGHVSANLRDPAEKQSLLHFLGVPLLDQNFSGAYLRFDDGSADEILAQLRRNAAVPEKGEEFAATWNKSMANLNPDESARLLEDWLAEKPTPFFYSELLDDRLGAFEVVVDSRRSDSVMIGQERWAGGNRFYDVWASYPGNESTAAPLRIFVPVSYSIDTTIEPDRTLRGTTTIELRADRGGEQAVALELSRFLKVQSAQDDAGHDLPFLQNESINRNQLAQRGNDLVFVYLPEKARLGQSFRIRISYRGNVISDAGNGLYFVGNRGTWYPHLGGMGQFATYETTFHWPHKLQLVATGEKIEEHEAGEERTGRWRSEGPANISGFNLGDYRIETIETVAGVKIEVAANPALDTAIAEHLRSQSIVGPAPEVSVLPSRHPRTPPNFSDEMPSPQANALNEVGQKIANAIRFDQLWMGPFPYRRLVVSQLPGATGQGFPGLVYLPSLTFISTAAQQNAGITARTQEAYDAIVPYHEVAHQWWGSVVGWDNYRDQWLAEGLANYIALAGADSERPSSHLLAQWLDRYRKALTTPSANQKGDLKTTPDDAGPLVHGYRLNSSLDPDAYQKVVYGKGTWVFHMLRMMMQDPSAKNPDQRFINLLHGLLESHRNSALTTDDLQKAVERGATPAMAIEGGHSMDWFFEQYVKSTGVPTYEVQYSVRPGAKGFQVRGKLIQKNVPDSFVLRVPIYAQGQSAKPVLLGHVVTSGDETAFQFVTSVPPKKLVIDPQTTLLCLTSAASSPPSIQ